MELDTNYSKPMENLPIAPPELTCAHITKPDPKCDQCSQHMSWKRVFKNRVNDILLRCNLHNCTGGAREFKMITNASGSKDVGKKYRSYVGCMSNKFNKCKARFPRMAVKETVVNKSDGSILMKKSERMLNTVTYILTYLFGCNTDVTSLLSGTAMKAVVFYITNYISKTPLKTHVIFDLIRSTLDKNTELIGGDVSRQEKARSLITKMVNALTAKLEIGAPMAAMYLLGHPDHYTNERFATFYWKSYVNHVQNSSIVLASNIEESNKDELEKVMIRK
jgi:hypothetical protein